MTDPAPSQRIDKWLWHARFFKTRAIAQRRAEAGHIRLNGNRVEKPSAAVRVGDTLTIPTAKEAIAVRVLALGIRRGPPAEARALYEVVGSRPKRDGPALEHVRRLFDAGEYLAGYRAWTDLRVEQNPHEAVGGMWEKIGALQLAFLRAHGLEPHHTLLDIGCGTLRAGRQFIRYLDAGCYTGFDMSEKAIDYARGLVEAEGLSPKRPELIHVPDGNLRFGFVAGPAFDFLLAQSVFTHLHREHIDECFVHVASVMAPGATFFFTFFEAEAERHSNKAAWYPFAVFEEVAAARGFRLERCRDYDHPRGQQMVAARPA